MRGTITVKMMIRKPKIKKKRTAMAKAMMMFVPPHPMADEAV
jgi:hypothetical protein